MTSADTNDLTEHSDADITGELDSDLLKMSADAMAILNSLSDEVNDDNDQKKKTKKKEIAHIDDLDIGGDDDDDDTDNYDDDDDTVGDMSLGDDSITKEVKSLRNAQKDLERELNSQDVSSMQEAMAKLKQQPLSPLSSPFNSPTSTKSKKKSSHLSKQLGEVDQQIIQRILQEEKERQKTSNIILEYVERYSLYGPGYVGCGKQLDVTLLIAAVGVWSILFGLSYHVMNAEFWI